MNLEKIVSEIKALEAENIAYKKEVETLKSSNESNIKTIDELKKTNVTFKKYFDEKDSKISNLIKIITSLHDVTEKVLDNHN